MLVSTERLKVFLSTSEIKQSTVKSALVSIFDFMNNMIPCFSDTTNTLLVFMCAE